MQLSFLSLSMNLRTFWCCDLTGHITHLAQGGVPRCVNAKANTMISQGYPAPTLNRLFFSFAFRNLLRKWEGRSAWKNNVHFVHSILSFSLLAGGLLFLAQLCDCHTFTIFCEVSNAVKKKEQAVLNELRFFGDVRPSC